MADEESNCIFCHLATGRVKARKVAEDSDVVAILDINPASPGHVLVLPKKHYMIMPQMPDQEIGHIFSVAKSVSGLLLRALKVRGTNIFVANGAAAGQKAPHAMVHVIPRMENDGLGFVLPEKQAPPAGLEALRQKLLPGIHKHLSHSVQDDRLEGALK